MSRAAVFACALLLALSCPAAGAHAVAMSGSKLALPVWTQPDGDLLAQRVIDREWGLPDDSTYHEVDVPGWKSEGGAMAMSALLPGTGQLYVGENTGWAFLLIETAGWLSRHLALQDADQLDGQSQAFVGNPYDSTAGWSLARYEASGGGDTEYLERLWSGDREAYYRTLSVEPAYAGGFTGSNSSETQQQYIDLRGDRDAKLHASHRMETLLWINHLVAAVDAFRVARIHNLPLRQQYELRLGQKFRRGRPEFRAAVVRRF